MKLLKIKVTVEGKPSRDLQIQNEFSQENQVEIVQEINKQLREFQGLKLFIKEKLNSNLYYLGPIPSNTVFHVTLQEITINKYKILLQNNIEIQKISSKLRRRTIKEVRSILKEIEGQTYQSEMGVKVENFNKACQQISEKTSTVRQYAREVEFGKIFYFDFIKHEDSSIGQLYKYNKSIKKFILNNIQNRQIQGVSTKQLLAELQVSLQEMHSNCCLNSANLEFKNFEQLQEEIDRMMKKQNNKAKVKVASLDRSHQSQQMQKIFSKEFEKQEGQTDSSRFRQPQCSVFDLMSPGFKIDQKSQFQLREIDEENDLYQKEYTEASLDQSFECNTSEEQHTELNF